MSWKGMCLKSGIDTDGENVDIYRGKFNIRGVPVSCGKFTYEDFRSNPLSCKSGTAGGTASGTAGDVNLLLFEHNAFECCVLGAGQTKIVPVIAYTDADDCGLDVAGDLADNEGFEITQGILGRSRSAFIVGTHAFYGKLSFYITDISGTDDCAFGFRKAEAYQANIDDYADMACLNVISGNITIETILNGGGTASQDTAEDWGDEEEHTLEVYVNIDGDASYRVDGAVPTTLPSAVFTFDADDIVVPFFYFLNTGDFAEETLLKVWEVGLLPPGNAWVAA